MAKRAKKKAKRKSSKRSAKSVAMKFGRALEIGYARDGKKYRHTWPSGDAPCINVVEIFGKSYLRIGPVHFVKR